MTDYYPNMDATSRVKSVKTITEMSKIMECLGISDDGLDNIHQMKDRVIEEIKRSQEQTSWSAGKAFSNVAVARAEDISKRKELRKIYEEVENIIGRCEDNLLTFLDIHFGCNVRTEIARKKDQLTTKEYILLFAGETSAGKSSLINLILGGNFLPHATLSVTSTICEVRYGESRKLNIYYNDDNTDFKEITLSDPNKGNSYIEQLSPYLRREKDRDKGCPIKKIKLYWPHELLKDGIVIVDSPGIGEYPKMDEIVSEYLLKAFFFVYVINTGNAGGFQKDRLIRLLEHVREKFGRSFVPEGAVFVCNKWDLIKDDPENEAIADYVVENLERYWPGVDSQSQVVKLSTTNAIISQDYGIISPQFKMFIESVKSMLFRTIKARLVNYCRWLDGILSRTHIHTTIIMRNGELDDPKKNFMNAKLALEVIKSEYESCIKKLEDKIKTKMKDIVERLIIHFKKPGFVKEFTTWSDNDCQEFQELTDEAKEKIEEMIKQRFEQEIGNWEAKNHAIVDALKSLMKRLQKCSDRFEFKVRAVEEKMLNGQVQSDNYELFTTTQKIVLGLTSPIWFPFALIGSIVGLPVMAGIAAKNLFKKTRARRLFKESKKSYVGEQSKLFLQDHVNEDSLLPFITPKFKQIQVNLYEMKSNFLKLLHADMFLVLHVLGRNLALCKAAEYYTQINADCSKSRGQLSIFTIQEIIGNEFDSKDLECNKDPIGRGTFADVYKGSFKTPGGKQIDVAVKVSRDMLTEKNAHELLSEELMLRSIDHQNVVKFYGAMLQKGDAGTKFIFVMELCAESVRMYIEKHQQCTPARAPENSRKKEITRTLEWAKDIACGLEHLHGMEIVHRDLKPENILIGSDRKTLKIADVGIAKDENEITGTLAGTPLYMAPEVFSESGVYNARADIYSFALILWELWYGQRVFIEVDSFQMLIKKIKENYRPSHIGGCYPVISEMESLMQTCWKSEPDDRFDAADCVKEINRALKDWKIINDEAMLLCLDWTNNL